ARPVAPLSANSWRKHVAKATSTFQSNSSSSNSSRSDGFMPIARGCVWVAHASRVLVSASRRNNLLGGQASRGRSGASGKVRDREDALASTRDACATQTSRPPAATKHLVRAAVL